MSNLQKILKAKAICESEEEYPFVLFHGTKTKFSKIDLDKSKEYTDFGRGFYLTNILEQAVEWAGELRRIDFIAGKRYLNNLYHEAYVLKFKLSLDEIEKMNVKIFEDYTIEWLKTIKACRLPRKEHDVAEGYDITIGPLADNSLKKHLDDFIRGKAGEEETLENIKFKKPSMQIAFHTERALGAITFIDQTVLTF